MRTLAAIATAAVAVLALGACSGDDNTKTAGELDKPDQSSAKLGGGPIEQSMPADDSAGEPDVSLEEADEATFTFLLVGSLDAIDEFDPTLKPVVCDEVAIHGTERAAIEFENEYQTDMAGGMAYNHAGAAAAFEMWCA